MTTPDYFLPEQFCNSGVQSIDYVIPPISSADPAAASLETGAPPLQQVRPSLGGAVFPRQQYNGALRLLSNILTYLNKGGEFTFDSKNTAGYALDAVLYDYASRRYVVSLHNANTANFVTNPTLINNTDWAFVSVTPAMLDSYAKLSANNTFTGINTAPTAPLGTNTDQLATMAALFQGLVTKQDSLGFTPVQQGGGAGQHTNKLFIGWSGSRIKAQVNDTDQGNLVTDEYLGNGTLPASFASLSSTGIVTRGGGIIASSQNGNGRWVKYDNGLIQQWSTTANLPPLGAASVINLPISFSTIDYSVSITGTAFSSNQAQAHDTVTDRTGSSFTLHNGSNLAQPFIWSAEGY